MSRVWAPVVSAAAAAAKTNQPVRQAMVSMTQTFIDTIIVVTMTCMVIIVTGAWRQAGSEDGSLMTSLGMAQGLGRISPALEPLGQYTVAIAVVFFAFTTLVGWCYYGERCMDYLVGRAAVVPFRIVFTLVVFVGATTELSTVWTFSDMANGLMALPNLLGLLLLSPIVVAETKKYFANPHWRNPDLMEGPDPGTAEPPNGARRTIPTPPVTDRYPSENRGRGIQPVSRPRQSRWWRGTPDCALADCRQMSGCGACTHPDSSFRLVHEGESSRLVPPRLCVGGEEQRLQRAGR